MKVFVVCGTTCTGKTDLAIKLAQEKNAEIINFDSQQVYADFNIGTAKPTPEQLAQVKHHLIGTQSPLQVYTAGDFRRDGLQILEKLAGQDKNAVLVGGTGFYLQALLKGMFEAPASDPKIKARLAMRLQQQGLPALYEVLKQKDPDICQKIHSHDQYRILRALEIIESKGRPLSQLRLEFKPRTFPYPTIKLGLRRNKKVLKEKIAERTYQMLQSGLVEEVESLIKKYGESAKPLQSVGYKEVYQYLKSKDPQYPTSFKEKAQLTAQITASTMKLAKRQSTWFKRDQEIHWMDPDFEDVLTKSLKF